MKQYWILICFTFIIVHKNLFAKDHMDIQRLKWKNLDVVWIKNNRLPTYNFSLYFADGALSDQKKFGETYAAFDLLASGTNRYTAFQLKDALEYYGVSIDTHVTHEYTKLTFSGLFKDIFPTTKMFCHILKDATFSDKELKLYKKRFKSQIHNIISSPSSLASKVFRKLSLKGTPYEEYAEGNQISVDKLSKKRLLKKLSYFKDKVYKRLYISGPEGIDIIKNVVTNECGISTDDNLYKRNLKKVAKKTSKMSIYFIPIKGQTQAQIRAGRFLGYKEILDYDLMKISSGLMGEGFTSKLMQELRVKRGLTYGVYAFAVPQKYYGRLGIITSTKNKNLFDMLTNIKFIFDQKGLKEISIADIKTNQGRMLGAHLFELETDSSFLDKIMYYDHIEKNTLDIFSFQDKLFKVSKEEVIKEVRRKFDWNRMTLLIVGDKSLLPQLKKIGTVKEVNFRKLI